MLENHSVTKLKRDTRLFLSLNMRSNKKVLRALKQYCKHKFGIATAYKISSIN